MFNALNRFISRLDGDPQQQQRREQGGYGFQVLRNANLELGIEPWFDFIVAINGREIDNPDPRLFAQEVRNCAGGTVALGLWSAKGQRTRVLHLPVTHENPSLGLSLQYTPLALVSNIWHVLDVPSNSPADNAGLLPYSDYILGTPDGVLHGEGGLGEMVEDYIGRPLRLWVYNNEYNVTREVEIVPSREWGGEGALGCVLGYGALHRLPAPLDEPVNAPGETMFDGGFSDTVGAAADQFTTLAPPPQDGAEAFSPSAQGASSSDFLVPAQMVGAPPPPAAGGAPPRGGRKKDRHAVGHGPNRLMDDYFAEEEKKSRDLDGASSRPKATPPPPPPKTGGVPPPPKAGPPRASPQPTEEAAEENNDVD
ncbi:GRASP55/65 PDZ-like domain-containing protein [Truncatella angustata]|uniref:GRASP55/65 PDZ-like domain-containing protein n=1 Tax=Truncatella angustata TaxID=152316 RepID=A0A9P9A4J0_9PEZI|nr:GRASP55/65 PDZ-like domain-containing protein [Truncatella angustata]KAH6659929.1 GRASP55/65 PDZ-like domain-containing protein [Truncatella angustata]